MAAPTGKSCPIHVDDAGREVGQVSLSFLYEAAELVYFQNDDLYTTTIYDPPQEEPATPCGQSSVESGEITEERDGEPFEAPKGTGLAGGPYMEAHSAVPYIVVPSVTAAYLKDMWQNEQIRSCIFRIDLYGAALPYYSFPVMAENSARYYDGGPFTVYTGLGCAGALREQNIKASQNSRETGHLIPFGGNHRTRTALHPGSEEKGESEDPPPSGLPVRNEWTQPESHKASRKRSADHMVGAEQDYKRLNTGLFGSIELVANTDDSVFSSP